MATLLTLSCLQCEDQAGKAARIPHSQRTCLHHRPSNPNRDLKDRGSSNPQHGGAGSPPQPPRTHHQSNRILAHSGHVSFHMLFFQLTHNGCLSMPAPETWPSSRAEPRQPRVRQEGCCLPPSPAPCIPGTRLSWAHPAKAPLPVHREPGARLRLTHSLSCSHTALPGRAQHAGGGSGVHSTHCVAPPRPAPRQRRDLCACAWRWPVATSGRQCGALG